MQLKDAGRDEIERMLRRFGPAQTSLGRNRERFLLGSDAAGRPVGALRLASLQGTLDDRGVRIARLGPPLIFPEAARPGRAGELVTAALAEARASGHTLALAFTTGAGGTDGLDGFRALPCSEAACRVVLPVPWPKEPAWLAAGEDPLRSVPGLRPGRPDDLDEVAAIHAGEVGGQRLRIDRDRGVWEQILAARGDAPFWVIEKEGRVEAYVLLGAGRPTARWLEHGARPEAGRRLADLFWSALAWARVLGLQRIEGWRMPDVLTVAPLYPTSDRGRKGSVPMLRALDPGTPLPEFKREDECRLGELDAF